MATDTTLIHKIRIALEFAGQAERGIIDGSQDDLRDLIEVREAGQEDFIDISDLADAFCHFAMNVRAAERKGKPIVPYAFEKDLPQK